MTPSELSASRLRRILAEVQADRAAFHKRASEVLAYADRALTAEQAAAAALGMERASRARWKVGRRPGPIGIASFSTGR